MEYLNGEHLNLEPRVNANIFEKEGRLTTLPPPPLTDVPGLYCSTYIANFAHYVLTRWVTFDACKNHQVKVT